MVQITQDMFAKTKKEVTEKAKKLCKKRGYARVLKIRSTTRHIRFLDKLRKIYAVTFES